ncbi:cupin domain-containing protein [Lysinibacillus sp. NPDC047702]|uniref:cupin domain-containing protein n=1 Tax=unclassified Lysinibacillus TaxID=2636778 RepID=UPI003D01EF86
MKLEDFIVYSDTLLIDALKKIDKNTKGFVCIVDSKYILKGVLTDGDIRRELIENGNLYQPIPKFISVKYEFLYEDESFDFIVEKFKNDKIIFLPIISREGMLVNVLTKKQLHELLIQGRILDLKMDFENYNEAKAFEIHNRPWGFYKTVILSEFVQVKILQVFSCQELSLQFHNKREEHWVVVKGKGKMTIGDSIREISEGSYIFIPKGCKHRVKNISETEPLIISEVQLGDYFGEDDIIRIEDIYKRI